MSHVKKIIGLGLIMLVSLSACADDQAGAAVDFITPGVEGAIYDGIILFFEEAPETDINLIQVEIRDLYGVVDLRANMHFPETERVSFERIHGYVTLFVQVGDRVQEGDLLATLSFEDEEFLINHRFAEIRLEQFDRDFTQSLREREVEIANARQRMNDASNNDVAAATLAVQLLETDLQIFRRNMQIAREAVSSVLDEMNSLIAGDNLYSPISGVIDRTIRDGAFVTDPSSIVTIVNDESFFFLIEADGRTISWLPDYVHRNSIMRFGDIVSLESTATRTYIDYYGIETTLPLVELDVVNITDTVGGGWTGLAVNGWARPVDTRAFMQAVEDIGLSMVDIPVTFRGYIHFDLATDAMIVPRSALNVGVAEPYRWVHEAGSVRQVPVPGAHYVLEYIDGVLHQRFVVMGITRPGYVQILSGLSPDSLVVVPR